MSKDVNCAYCMEGELLDKFGIKICDMDASSLVLFKEQSHKGRVIVAPKQHVGDMTLMSDEERNAYFADVNKAAAAIKKAFNPDKINFGAFGDTSGHLHFHLVPKYKDGFEWGTVFAMNPEKVFLSEDEYKEIMDKIVENL